MLISFIIYYKDHFKNDAFLKIKNTATGEIRTRQDDS